ncbi:hypothetical protein O6H91_03G078200 [Diphasiastrum complanatum]|nr:hypothetical protein O6H91_03G078200 [Diphasiastrum complanatum]KAJ7562639.1 hypothetical protein O6H91_03G078200 [Diphasiastrum complanatum]KAJ7562640.1 hypothetical protein O6H91_03G078200 [Diphasiastrum complanatum]
MTYGQESRTKELWEEFFLDPSQWWDNRSDKRNQRFPDFKHKTTKKALWIHNKFNPPWVHARLAAMVECQEQAQSGWSTPEISRGGVVRMEQLWQEFFSDPSQWWDNRFIKKSLKYPDFKHKSTHEGLWIESWLNPPWVKAKMITSLGGLRSRVTGSFGNGDIVSKLCQEGRLIEALHMVELMLQQNIQAPIDAYVALLKACARRKALVEGKQVHALLVQSGRDSDVFLGSTLLDMYAKCGSVVDALKVFNMMPEHTVFSWTALMSAYAEHGQCEEAINLFQRMQRTGIAPDKVSFVVVIKACGRIAALEEGKEIHSHIIKSGFESDVVVGSSLVGMYAKCGCLEDACAVFNKMNERDAVSWNVMITGYAQQGFGKKALALYEQMKQEGVQPDIITYVVLLNACGRIAALEQGERLHSYIIRSGFESAVIVGSALVDMYAKCGHIGLARQVFNKMQEPNVLSWNAMIAGYAEHGLGKEALALYEQMIQQGAQANDVTFVVLLKACASIVALEQGQQLHSHINESGFGLDVIVSSALIDMYAKCGSIEHACQVFDNMSERDVVSWSVMIGGYAQQGLGKEALGLYEQMKQLDVQPDNVLYVVLLNACASIAALDQGKQLHSDIIRSGFELGGIVDNALIDMYAKCGCIEDAREVFVKMNERDVVSWTAMISGYAEEGLGKEALTLWEQMQREGMKPNEVTYASILSACSHSGLVDEGRHLFDSMFKNHGVTPTVDHYACMVDLLGRAGCLTDAENFINKMPIQPDAVVWMALLGAARNCGHVEIGRRAFDCVVKLEPENASAYVLLSNIYAAAGRRNELAKIRK